MDKILITLMALALCTSSLWAQQSNIDKMLQTVEANNKSLAAYRSLMKSETLQYKGKNKLPDPEASAYYLPFGRHQTGDYMEFEVSQRVEFPSVYAARRNLIVEQKKRLDLEYQELKQDVLLRAKNLGLEMIYLQRQKGLIEKRVSQSKKVNEQVQTLFDKGQAGILVLNKAKIVWLDQQFALEELNTRESNLKQEIQSLNGGHEVTLELATYPEAGEIAKPESLWNERMNQDAQIALLEQEKQVAEHRLKVKRNQLLPDLTAGYNYQGVAGNNYSGFYAAISIPLWSGRNQVETAEAKINYFGDHESDVIISMKSEYMSQIKRFNLLLNKFDEYQMAMDGLDSEMLLEKSYRLGEISFMDYYREISFYREAENRMIEIEKELQQLRSELFKHQL